MIHQALAVAQNWRHAERIRNSRIFELINMASRPIEHLSEIAASGTPAYVVDPQTQATFVLLSAQQYERIRPFLDDEHFDISEAYPLMDEVARSEGWDDPEMDVYDQLPARQP